MRFLLITDPGIEDLAAEELRERVPGARTEVNPYGRPGQVRVEGAAPDSLMDLTTIHHVIEVSEERAARSLDDVRRTVRGVDLPELAAARSFRVTSTRTGEHPFDRKRLEGAAGAAVQARYGTPVDLERPQFIVRVDLYGDRLVVGLQRTHESLGKRLRRAKALRTAIQPTTAAAMIRLAGAHRGAGRLIDPMCGSGTIPVEAKRINPALDVFASDWDRATVEVARGTVSNHGLDVEVQLRDARTLTREDPVKFDFIVTDPPYGVRLGRRSGVARLYRALAPAFDAMLADAGKVVVAVLKRRTFLKAFEDGAFQVLEERTVGDRGLRPHLLVLGRS